MEIESRGFRLNYEAAGAGPAIVLIPGQVFSRAGFIDSYRRVANLGFFEEPMPVPSDFTCIVTPLA